MWKGFDRQRAAPAAEAAPQAPHLLPTRRSGSEPIPASFMMVLSSHMPRQTKPAAVPFAVLVSVLLLLCSGSHAQENCNVETKLLLSPAETQAAIAALAATKETAGRIYFFDTAALNLLSQGAIVRLRQGAKTDLTVKLRPPNGKKFSAPTQARDGFKCEVDMTQEGANSSYSITAQLATKELPRTGTDVARLLSPAQIKLLQDAQISVDWTAVKRIAEITSTDWQTEPRPRLGKLTLELWEWPGGKALELSAKVSSDAASSTYAELQQLVKTKQLTMSADQRVKTRIALEAITHPAAH
jgi:hypothetical protein